MIEIDNCQRGVLNKAALFLVGICLHVLSAAQSQTEKIPLHQLFQEHYDSTIIYQQGALRGTPDYFIIAKKDTLISCFRYTRPYPILWGRQYPSVLTNKFITENVKYGQVIPDTNLYFRVYEASLNSRREGWQAINAFTIWNLSSNINWDNKNCQIYDGAFDTYFLITKERIKILEYYEAEYFEGCEGSNVNRRNEIHTRKAIFKLFNFSNRSLQQ